MRTADFDFDLPEQLIALRPAEPRGSARLLVLQPDGRMEHRKFRELPDFLNPGDILAFNDSRVIPARLTAIRPPRGDNGQPSVVVSVTIYHRLAAHRYRAFAQPARRLRPGDLLDFGEGLQARVLTREGPDADLEFDREGPALDQAIAAVGAMPLPPYIASRRAPDQRDRTDYQTVFAARNGSVAAPTAGLHFTPELLSALAAQGVEEAFLTLHVGPGTFLPVAAEDTRDHRMHAESVSLDASTASRINAARRAGHRLAAVGTTVLRSIESAADADGQVHPFEGETDIFITPGYRFRAVDMLLTNFHLPRSTLFMLVSAFMGLETMQRAYAEAIREKYRFYSYGDACLLIRPR